LAHYGKIIHHRNPVLILYIFLGPFEDVNAVDLVKLQKACLRQIAYLFNRRRYSHFEIILELEQPMYFIGLWIARCLSVS
jgi:hypothetical protein